MHQPDSIDMHEALDKVIFDMAIIVTSKEDRLTRITRKGFSYLVTNVKVMMYASS